MRKFAALMVVCFVVTCGLVSCKKDSSPAPAAPQPAAPTATPTVTWTGTASPTVTWTNTHTATPTLTSTPTSTHTVTSTPTATANATSTAIPSACTVFGRKVVEPGNIAVSGGTYAFLYSNVLATSVTLHALGVTISTGWSLDTDADVQLGIYTNNAGEPDALLRSTAHFIPVGGDNYQVITPIVLSPGTYWIAAIIYPGAGGGGTVTSDGAADWAYTSALDSSRTRMKAWTKQVMDLPSSAGSSTAVNWDLSHFGYYCP